MFNCLVVKNEDYQNCSIRVEWDVKLCSVISAHSLSHVCHRHPPHIRSFLPFSPHISSSSLHLHVTSAISSQSSLLDPLDHPYWSLFSNLQLTPVSRSQTVLAAMPHLTCETIFLLLLVFLISSILHHHPALLHRHTLILDHLLTFLVAFYTLVFKLSFSRSLPVHSCL